ncbi:hypothetical protein E1832_17430 [Antarcticimicrobium luteum]|uniref:Lipoprotein n=2 Tax=Antarcticimicrobium luteum TaxID=2547397 RepID=A0A4R5UVJ4_9RHOB|nr:hypothetical protein E1832_17430 [Antarcticimicrobium luteum]
MVKGAVCAALCLLTLGGCTGNKDKQLRFDGHQYRTKAKPADRKMSIAAFTVEVKNVSQSLKGARAAGEYAGVRYCVTNYGSSRIDWDIGPETDPGTLMIDRDTLTFRGTCLKP